MNTFNKKSIKVQFWVDVLQDFIPSLVISDYIILYYIISKNLDSLNNSQGFTGNSVKNNSKPISYLP